MYTALKPVYDFLFLYIRDHFSLYPLKNHESRAFFSDEAARNQCIESGEIDPFFKRFERGPFRLDHPTLGNTSPMSWLEFGQTTDIEDDRSPQGYTYELRYEMPVLVCDPREQVLETYRSRTELNRGVGDIISEVVQKAWEDLHLGLSSGGNFGVMADGMIFGTTNDASGQLNLSDTNWWVKRWSVDVGSEVVDTISEWQQVRDQDPTARAKIINWDFTIFEQEALNRLS